jgi:YARHG domain
MRKLLLILSACFFISCNNDSKTKTGSTEKENSATSQNTNEASTPLGSVLENLLGSFVGVFGENKITLLITKAEADSISGRSIVGGNNRPFNGTMILKDGVYSIVAKEPGDHPDDGVFNFSIRDNNTDVVTGSWTPNDTKRKTKDYTLQRREFKYQAGAGSYPEASERLLKPEDVENLMKEDLEFMRNEIFARHGYCFKKKHLRQQFENEDWYVPDTVDIKGRLTEIEKKNIDMIKRYEKYAEEYGDEYGR